MSLADDIIHAMREAADDGERAIAHLIAAEAKRLAPVGTPDEGDDHVGELRDSIKAERNQFGGWTVSANTPYAAKQHEALGFRHPHGGRAKYLEHALQKIGPQLDRAIAATVESHLRTGVRIRGASGR
jgi:hypothetical protein